MSEITLLDYVPDTKENYAMVRSLSYRAFFSVAFFKDLTVLIFFCILGFLVTNLMLGSKIDFELLKDDVPLFMSIILVFWSLFLGWRFFRIWSIAPSLNEPEPLHFKFAVDEEDLIIESGKSRIVVPQTSLSLYLDHKLYFAFQLNQGGLPHLLPKRAFVENGEPLFRSILVANGQAATWWTMPRLMGW
jgi:hypothetical protein